MSRVKRGKSHLKRRHNILRLTKGYRWGRKSKIKLAKTAILKAGGYAFADRRIKKRTNRGLWQIKINAAARQLGSKYSAMINNLKKAHVELNRKVLAEIGESYPEVFKMITNQIK